MSITLEGEEFMLWIHVLRVRCEPLSQGGLFDEPRSPADIILDAIRSAPTANVGRGSEWHIGKPEVVDGGAIGFKMGRTTAVTVPQFDVEAHDFYEAEVERAPYTFGLFDSETQACGIVKKAGVSQNASEVAAKLERLLNASAAPEKAGYRIVVDPITDPQGFIEQLRSASTITRFSFTASFPNPFDVEALIQRPAEEFTKVAGGEKTKVEVRGENLNEEVLEDLARGIASTGDQASATIRQKGIRRGKPIYLRGNPVQESVEAEGPTKSIYGAMRDATRAAYYRVRNALL